MKTKWVYGFNSNKTEGDRNQKSLLGGKGANLAEMSSLKLCVPPGFTVTTDACLDFQKTESINEEIKSQIKVSLSEVEKIIGKKFGDKSNPLLFSVRSGARVSMPGMMDTVLNLGICEATVEGIITQTQNPRFAWDSYRRFIQMFSNVVLGFNTSLLESTLEDLKEAREVKEDTELTAEDLQELVSVYKKIIFEESGREFPNDPYEQLWLAIGAVFKSWNNPRAIKYRELHHYSHDWGTAVNVQSMVFGNMGEDSATGVCFTRDPSDGEKKFFGEYLVNAQGEDVVAGIRTPRPINEESKNSSNNHLPTLQEVMPDAYAELVEVYQKLEAHYKDMQDIEFTIEKGKLYILQTRNGKRTTAAALKIAVDFVSEGILSEKEALMRVNPEDLNQLLHPRIDPSSEKKLLATGLSASPGAASGEIVFTSEEAARLCELGKKVILVRQETSPEDITGMISAQGILTSRGGMTSHAAVVARGMGRPCVAGCTSALIDYRNSTLTIDGRVFKEGDLITIDGGSGEIFDGIVPTIKASLTGNFSTFMSWADKFRKLKVRTNADNPNDSEVAISFGAEGIGLCRTEHMFFDPERILAIRQNILADSVIERKKALSKILPFQRDDFKEIFHVMNGRPVNIRLLDPPLHEFLTFEEGEREELAKSLEMSVEQISKREKALHEFNPMLGHRGCRLGVTFPEIYEMQCQAIAEAACGAVKEGVEVRPEIMIPLIATDKELERLRELSIKVIDKTQEENNVQFEYKVGTMIELPRAAITAEKIAKYADFFSFGTNDLTQTTFGLSRDDAGKFLPEYINKNILPLDPFVSLDQDGVGFLVKFATEQGRQANSKMHIGICGEHGGEPSSIEFCHKIGLDYVSCSPFRVPIARLAAAQVALKLEN